MEASSSNTELNRTISAPVKHDHDTTSATLKPYSSEKKRSPSSPSKSSPPDNDVDADDDDHKNDKSTSCTTSSPSHKSDKTPVLETEPDPSPVTEAPSNQEMNRSPSAYRIPSSVFERSKSSTPTDWSVASNESLFSIHTGNMSFTKDHYFWRSGDLGPPAEASTSDQIFSYSAPESGGGASAGADMRSHELGIAEATMLEVIKESEGHSHADIKLSLAEVRHARRSQGSNTSNKSFAFSIMGVETGSSKRMPSSVRSNQEQSQSAQPGEAESQPDPLAPMETGNGGQPSWFSCFSCCSSR